MGGEFHRAYGMLGNFWQAYSQASQVEYCWPVMEPLAKKPSATLVWKPCLAESWETDPDACTFTVKIRDGVTFSDGSPFTVDDAIFSLAKRLEYGTGSTIGNPDSIEKVDDKTFVVKYPSFSLDYENWILIQYMYSKAAFEANGEDWMINNMLGTGPYILTEYTPDVRQVYARNENYWGDEVACPDSMVWLQMADTTTQVAAFINGEIDSVAPPQQDVVDMLKANGFEPVVGTGGGSFQMAQIVTKDPNDPLANQAVRQAIFHSGIDWDELGYLVAGDAAVHSDCIGVPGDPYGFMPYWKPEIETSKYDLEKAKKELADAGYPNGFSTKIYCGTSSTAVGAAMQEALKKLNITAEVENSEPSKLEKEYIGAIAIKSGIVIVAKAVGNANQMDRFNKFWNPTNSMYGNEGAHEYGPEAMEVWEKASTARSYEEQNQWLYEWVNIAVHEECAIWPIYCTGFNSFNQPWLHLSDEFRLTSGSDPFQLWIEKH